MRSKADTFFLILVVVGMAIFPACIIYFIISETGESITRNDFLSPIIRETSPLIRNSYAIDPSKMLIQGTYLVWDLDTNEERNVDLSDRATQTGDKLITIFFIQNRSTHFEGTYGSEWHEVRAYGETANIHVVSWPEKQYLGSFILKTESPGATIKVGSRQSIQTYKIEDELEKLIPTLNRQG